MESSEIWRPSAARIAAANLTRFAQCLGARRGTRLEGYEPLHTWSVTHPEEFWAELARFADVRAEWGAGPVIDHPGQIPAARYFPQARLNYAANLLRHLDDRAAIVFVNERGARRQLSHRELNDEVARVAAGLRTAGVGPGDRVAAVLPNLPEALIAMLASVSLGAVWSSCSPDIDVQDIQDRFGSIAPKVLFIADGYFYAGKTVDCLASMTEVAAALPSINLVIVVPYVEPAPSPARHGVSGTPTRLWGQLGERGAPLSFAQFPFDHPLCLLFSPGTAGTAQCIVHGAGGTLLQHQKEHLLHTDLRRGERIFHLTTGGEMMWTWLASALATGAAVVLYDGSPFHPDPGVLWRLAQAERLTVFGASMEYLAALEATGYSPALNVDLAALKALLAAGSPLLPESFDYAYRAIKPDLHLASMAIGPNVICCFALGCPTLPVRRGEIQCRGLGMAVEVFDEAGRPLRNTPGDLVCTAPFPAMPVSLWNDADGKRYRQSHFERFPGAWHDGRLAVLTGHGSLVVCDGANPSLNSGGMRAAGTLSQQPGRPPVTRPR